MTTLLTIGYSGLTIEQFTAELQLHSVRCLVDIRELPLSRKRGFSKRALASALESLGIEYLHHGKLGSPRSLRHEVRETRDYRKFYKGVGEFLLQEQSQEQLRQAVDTASRVRSCLMCFCPDWRFCHRKSVIDAISDVEPVQFEHLLVPALSDAA